MKQYFVYILECTDKSYYTGVTSELEKRLHEHKLGVDKNSYTFTRRPIILRYVVEFQDVNEAIQREKQVKGWSRKKKQALINNNFKELVKLSTQHGPTN